MRSKRTVRWGFGLAALLLAGISLVAGEMALAVAVAALVLLAVTAYLGDRVLVLATCLIILAKTFYLPPTLWTLIETWDPTMAAQTIQMYRILLLLGLLLPMILMGRHYVESRWTEIIIACLGLIGLGLFLIPIAWRVPQLPLLIVFGGVFLLAAFDFWRELRSGGQNGG
jgi:hypothetical protein